MPRGRLFRLMNMILLDRHLEKIYQRIHALSKKFWKLVRTPLCHKVCARYYCVKIVLSYIYVCTKLLGIKLAVTSFEKRNKIKFNMINCFDKNKIFVNMTMDFFFPVNCLVCSEQALIRGIYFSFLQSLNLKVSLNDTWRLFSRGVTRI